MVKKKNPIGKGNNSAEMVPTAPHHHNVGEGTIDVPIPAPHFIKPLNSISNSNENITNDNETLDLPNSNLEKLEKVPHIYIKNFSDTLSVSEGISLTNILHPNNGEVIMPEDISPDSVVTVEGDSVDEVMDDVVDSVTTPVSSKKVKNKLDEHGHLIRPEKKPEWF